jgi:hypothetical protein
VAYLPSYCGRCDRISLFPHESLERHLVCSACGKAARVLHGARYAAEDVPLFFRIEAAVEASSLSEADSYDLLLEVDGVPASAVASYIAFDSAAQRCAELAELRNSLRIDPNRAVRAVNMLVTILQARISHDRRSESRESGIRYSAATVEALASGARVAKLR